jgi:hypothetical protein
MRHSRCVQSAGSTENVAALPVGDPLSARFRNGRNSGVWIHRHETEGRESGCRTATMNRGSEYANRALGGASPGAQTGGHTMPPLGAKRFRCTAREPRCAAAGARGESSELSPVSLRPRWLSARPRTWVVRLVVELMFAARSAGPARRIAPRRAPHRPRPDAASIDREPARFRLPTGEARVWWFADFLGGLLRRHLSEGDDGADSTH